MQSVTKTYKVFSVKLLSSIEPQNFMSLKGVPIVHFFQNFLSSRHFSKSYLETPQLLLHYYYTTTTATTTATTATSTTATATTATAAATATMTKFDLDEARVMRRVTDWCLVHSSCLAGVFKDALFNPKGSLEWRKKSSRDYVSCSRSLSQLVKSWE